MPRPARAIVRRRSAHGGEKSYGWADLQLPLYVAAVQKHLALDTPPEACYALMPEAVGDTEFVRFEKLNENLENALQWAEEAARRIVAGVFWPPAPEVKVRRPCRARTGRLATGAGRRMGKVPCGKRAGQGRKRRVNTTLQHTSIRASAGTGKTFQLANRYLALLLLQALGDGKISPEKIVAVTFTRKGAGEFAERILNRLAAAAGDPDKREELRLDLERLVKGDEQQGRAGLAPGVKLAVDAATLQSALAVMIDQFDRLVLGTIDSFMARSVQTLAFELGLGGFEILEDAAIKRQRAALLGEVLRAVRPEHLESFYQTIKLATLKSSSVCSSS